MHRRPGKVRGGSWRGWLGLLRERPPTRHAPLCPDVRGLQHHPGPGSCGPSACRERGHRGGGAGGRRRGGGAPQDSRCERALRPQARGGGGGGARARAGAGAATASVGGAASGVRGAWGPPLLTDHPRSSLLKSSPTERSLQRVLSSPCPRGPHPRGSWTLSAFGHSTWRGQWPVLQPYPGRPWGGPSPRPPLSPGAARWGACAPPFLLLPSGPPPPDAHSPGPARSLGARVLQPAGRSHTEHASLTLQTSLQTASPDGLALPPQGPGGRW